MRQLKTKSFFQRNPALTVHRVGGRHLNMSFLTRLIGRNRKKKSESLEDDDGYYKTSKKDKNC
jgi:hypothetical protein